MLVDLLKYFANLQVLVHTYILTYRHTYIDTHTYTHYCFGTGDDDDGGSGGDENDKEVISSLSTWFFNQV